MTAWARLLEASSLAVGTAWELLTHPRTGTGVVLNDGYTVTLAAGAVATVDDRSTTVLVADKSVSAELVGGYVAEARDTAVMATLNDQPIRTEVA